VSIVFISIEGISVEFFSASQKPNLWPWWEATLYLRVLSGWTLLFQECWLCKILTLGQVS